MDTCEWGDGECDRPADMRLLNVYGWPIRQEDGGRNYCGLHIIRTVTFRVLERDDTGIVVVPLPKDGESDG